MAVELEAARFRRLAKPVEMAVEIEDALLRIEPHGFFEVGLRRDGHCFALH